MTKPYAIMAGDRYLFAGVNGLLGWTSDDRRAVQFADRASAALFAENRLGGDVRVVRLYR